MKRTPKKRRYTPEVIRELTGKLLEWIKEPSSLWLGEFAADNMMDRQRLTEIAGIDEDFAEALRVAKQVQENRLFRLGCSKEVNASMPIFALKNVAGWRDVQELKHTGKIEFGKVEVQKLSREALERIAKGEDVEAVLAQHRN